MRRIALVCALGLSLGGCASLANLTESAVGLPTGSLTASIQNPVTPTMLNQIESSLIVAVSGLNTYKRLCVQKTIDQSCRSIVVRLQGYTRQARPVLVNLRRFVRENDQVNASIAFTTIRRLVADLQSDATASGVSAGVQ